MKRLKMLFLLCVFVITSVFVSSGLTKQMLKEVEALTLIDAYAQINPIWNDGYYNMDVYDSFIENVGGDAWIKIKDVDFGNTITPEEFEFEYSSNSTQERPLEIRLDSIDGQLIGNGTITYTGGWEVFVTEQIELEGISEPLGMLFLSKKGNL